MPLKTITVRAHRSAGGNYIALGQAITMRLAQLPKDAVVVATVPTLFTRFGVSPERYEVTEADIIVRLP
jgi:hypothetical protein